MESLNTIFERENVKKILAPNLSDFKGYSNLELICFYIFILAKAMFKVVDIWR